MLGDVSAGLSVPMERLILNFGQVKAQAKLTGRELRDFAVAGVPILDELARNLNKSKSEIQDMVSAGKIGFGEVTEAFKSMTSEGGRFNNLMEEQAKTLLGRISNLKDNFELFLREQGNGLLVFAGLLVDKLATIVEWLRRDAQGFNLLGKTVVGVTKFFKALGLTAFAVFQPIAGIGVIAFETGKVLGAFVRDAINGFKRMGDTMSTIFGSIGQALKGNFKEAKDSLKDLFRDSVSETTIQMGKFDSVLADVAFGIEKGFKDATESWVDFSDLEGAEKVEKEFGILGEGVRNLTKEFTGLTKEQKKASEQAEKDFKKLTKEADQYANKIKQIEKTIQEESIAFQKAQLDKNRTFQEQLADMVASHKKSWEDAITERNELFAKLDDDELEAEEKKKIQEQIATLTDTIQKEFKILKPFEGRGDLQALSGRTDIDRLVEGFRRGQAESTVGQSEKIEGLQESKGQITVNFDFKGSTFTEEDFVNRVKEALSKNLATINLAQ